MIRWADYLISPATEDVSLQTVLWGFKIKNPIDPKFTSSYLCRLCGTCADIVLLKYLVLTQRTRCTQITLGHLKAILKKKKQQQMYAIIHLWPRCPKTFLHHSTPPSVRVPMIHSGINSHCQIMRLPSEIMAQAFFWFSLTLHSATFRNGVEGK